MGVIHVNPAQLTVASQALTASSTAISVHLGALTMQAGVLRASWSGDAQVAFDTAQQRYTALMRERSDLVSSIAAALAALGEQYSTTDLAGQRLLGGS